MIASSLSAFSSSSIDAGMVGLRSSLLVTDSSPCRGNDGCEFCDFDLFCWRRLSSSSALWSSSFH